MNKTRYGISAEKRRELIVEVQTKGSAILNGKEAIERSNALSEFRINSGALVLQQGKIPPLEHADGLEQAIANYQNSFGNVRQKLLDDSDTLLKMAESAAQALFRAVATQEAKSRRTILGQLDVAIISIEDSKPGRHLDLKSAGEFMKRHATPEAMHFYQEMVGVVQLMGKIPNKLPKGLAFYAGKKERIDFFHGIDKKIAFNANRCINAANLYEQQTASSSSSTKSSGRGSIGNGLNRFVSFIVGHGHTPLHR